MKYSHNKKRNTAFIYETLIVEMSKCVLENKMERHDSVLQIIKKHFKKGSSLNKDLNIYKSFDDTSSLGTDTLEKLISEAKKQFTDVDRKIIFDAQTKLISEVNKTLGASVWNNFVAKYRKLATVNQVLEQSQTPKKQVLMEKKLIDTFLTVEQQKSHFPNVNNLAVKSFISKFNEEYSSVLNEEQKVFLNKYIMSSGDGELEFKMHLYEEIDRLKNSLVSVMKETDNQTKGKLQKIVEKMSSYREKKINKDLVSEIMKIQSLVSEFK